MSFCLIIWGNLMSRQAQVQQNIEPVLPENEILIILKKLMAQAQTIRELEWEKQSGWKTLGVIVVLRTVFELTWRKLIQPIIAIVGKQHSVYLTRSLPLLLKAVSHILPTLWLIDSLHKSQREVLRQSLKVDFLNLMDAGALRNLEDNQQERINQLQHHRIWFDILNGIISVFSILSMMGASFLAALASVNSSQVLAHVIEENVPQEWYPLISILTSVVVGTGMMMFGVKLRAHGVDAVDHDRLTVQLEQQTDLLNSAFKNFRLAHPWKFLQNATMDSSLYYLQITKDEIFYRSHRIGFPRHKTIKQLHSTFVYHGVMVVIADEDTIAVQGKNLSEKKLTDIAELFLKRVQYVEKMTHDNVQQKMQSNLKILLDHFVGNENWEWQIVHENNDQCLPEICVKIIIKNREVLDLRGILKKLRVSFSEEMDGNEKQRLTIMGVDGAHNLEKHIESLQSQKSDLVSQSNVQAAKIPSSSAAYTEQPSPPVQRPVASQERTGFLTRTWRRAAATLASSARQENSQTPLIVWQSHWPEGELFALRSSFINDNVLFLLFPTKQMQEILGDHFKKFYDIAQRGIIVGHKGQQGIVHANTFHGGYSLPFKLKDPKLDVRVYLRVLEKTTDGKTIYIPALIKRHKRGTTMSLSLQASSSDAAEQGEAPLQRMQH